MNIKSCDGLILMGETEKNLPQGHFIYQNSHITDPGAKMGCHREWPATNHLSCSMSKEDTLRKVYKMERSVL
jgi:hypothetical protein